MKQYAESTLKRLTKDELIEIIRCLEHNVKGLEEFKLLMEKDMYAWHDLRKDPEDLPKDNAQVMVKAMGVYLACDYCDKCFEYAMLQEFTTGYLYSSDVSAWRYIDPPEEDNE